MPFGIDEKVWKELVSEMCNFYDLNSFYFTFTKGEINYSSQLYLNQYSTSIYLPFFYRNYKINSKFNG